MIADWLSASWWSYSADPESAFSRVYRLLNLVEGSIWIVLAVLVLGRFLRHRRTWLEIPYACAFATFGASDFREAVNLQTWLILAKGVNLAALLWLRARVLTSLPGAKSLLTRFEFPWVSSRDGRATSNSAAQRLE